MENRNDSRIVPARFVKIPHINIHINSVDFFSMHEHEVLELVLVLRGKGTFACDEGRFLIGPGDIRLRNYYEPHEIATNDVEPLNTLCIQVSASFCRDYFSQLRNLRFDTAALAKLPGEDLQMIHDLAIGAARDFFEEELGYQMACVGKISSLLALLINRLPHEQVQNSELMTNMNKRARKHRIVKYIDQHYKEKITLEKLAELECVTTTHLCHFFREVFHLSFREYLNKVRLEKVLILIRNPDLYLVDICMETGFSDSRYLNTVFKKTFGVSLSEYRRRQLATDAVPDTFAVFRPEDGVRYSRQGCIQMIREHIASGGFRY